MKFSLTFLKDNIAMFQFIALQEDLDYIAFYPSKGLYVIAESWEELKKSTFFVEC